jgi:hypothetical protein
MEHLPEWAFCFLHCDPKNGGKICGGNMPSNCTKKIGAGLHNAVETNLSRRVEIRVFSDLYTISRLSRSMR